MAPAPYTTTYTILNTTYTYTYDPNLGSTNTDIFGGYDPYNENVGAAIAGYAIALGVIFGIHAIALIVVAIIYFKRQKRRKAWYGPMAEHYRHGGLPPWAIGGGRSLKAPLAENDYNSYPPPSSRPQYDPPQQYSAYTPPQAAPERYSTYTAYEPPPERHSTYTPYEGTPQKYVGY